MTSTTAASEPASNASALMAQLRKMASGRSNPLTWSVKHNIGDVQLKAVAFTSSSVSGVCVRISGFIKRESGFFFKTDVTFDVSGDEAAFGSQHALAEVAVEPVNGTSNDTRNGATNVIWSNAMPRKTFAVISLRDFLQKASMIVAKYLDLAIARDEGYLVRRSKEVKEAKASDGWHELAEKNGVAVAFVYCVSTGRWVMERRGKDVRYPGTWGLPGGAIENMESPIEAAKRELSEEVGIHNARFVKQVDLGGDPKAVCVVFVVNQESKLRKSVESAAVVWTDYFMDNLIPVMEDQLSVYKDIVTSLKKSAPGSVNLDEFTPEFKRWFGASKVVDHNGKPMRMFHGTTYDIAEFKREFVGHGNDQEGSGFYFTNDPDHAGGYASDTPKENLPAGGRVAGPNIMPTYLRITKPVTNKPLTRVQIQRIIANGDQDALYNFGDVDYDGKAKVIQQAVDAYHDNGHTTKQTLFNLANDFYSGMDGKFLQVVKAVTGYDGVIVDYPNGRVVAVVFGPEQIKSVYNKKPGMRTSRVAGSAEPRSNDHESKFTAYIRDLAERHSQDSDLSFNVKLAGHETRLTFFDVTNNLVEFTVNIVLADISHIVTMRFARKGNDSVLELVPESSGSACVQIIPRDHTKNSRSVVVSNRTKYSVHVDDNPKVVLKAAATLAFRVVNLVTDNKVTSSTDWSDRHARTHKLDLDENRVIRFPVDYFKLKNDQNYKKAKAGDLEAAALLIGEVADTGTLERIRSLFHGCVFVTPHALEARGRNAIPQVLAIICARLSGGRVDCDIVQTNRVRHTSAGPEHRFTTRAVFDGSVQFAKYVLVDDNITSAATMADLGSYISRNGGRVVGAVALTSSINYTTLSPEPKLHNDLRKRFGKEKLDELLEEYGHTFNALTAYEVWFLSRFRNVDAVRNRLTKAAQTRDNQPSQPAVRNLPEGQKQGEAEGCVTSAAEPQAAAFDALRRLALKAPKNTSGLHNMQLRSGDFHINIIVSDTPHAAQNILDIRFHRGEDMYASYDYYSNGNLSLVHSIGVDAPQTFQIPNAKITDVKQLLVLLIRFMKSLRAKAVAAAEPGDIEKTIRDGRQYVIALALKPREWTTKIRGVAFHLQNLTDRVNENENVLDVQVRITYGSFMYTASLQWFKKRDEIVTSRVPGSNHPNHISTSTFNLGSWLSNTCASLLDRLWSEEGPDQASRAGHEYRVVPDGGVFKVLRKSDDTTLARISEKDVLDAIVCHGSFSTANWVDALGRRFDKPSTAHASQSNPTPQQLGVRIKKILNTREAYAILDKAGPGIDTWLAGGCALLAASLSRLGLGALTVLEGRSGNGPWQVQHWLVQAGGFCFDGDGASTPAALLKRWRDVEGVVEAALRPATADDRKHSTYTSARRPEVVQELENLLRQHLQLEN
jgi:ADP-ribose pyrophosphatase YjhB (NUDIX family)